MSPNDVDFAWEIEDVVSFFGLAKLLTPAELLLVRRELVAIAEAEDFMDMLRRQIVQPV